MLNRRFRHWWVLFLAFPCAHAQNARFPESSAESTTAAEQPSVSEKWDFFVSETATPFTLVAAGLDATASQLTRSAPLYGRHFWGNDAFPKRMDATLGDDTSENFFADFVLASALHEDTRYIRKGPSRGMWPRIGYALSRAVNHANRFRRRYIQLGKRGWMCDERGVIERVLSTGEQNG